MKNPPRIAPKAEGIIKGHTSLKKTVVSSFAHAATICKAIPTAGLMQVLPVILPKKRFTFAQETRQQGQTDIFAKI